MSPDQIMAFVAALVAAEPDASNFPVFAQGGADSRYEVAATPCPRPLAPSEIEGETIICGTVNVPEDHDAPDGRRLDLTFAIYRSRSLVPARDAVVHLHGGPGGGIIEQVALTTNLFEKLRARRDIVAFDQRGVDTSRGDTQCFATIAENVDAMAKATIGKAAPTLKGDLTAACIAELKRRGIDISKINTEQNARDVQAVMRALGYPEYNIYGLSYGTKLGLEVMRTAPEGLRAVVVDSVAPPHVPTYDTLILPHYEALQSTFDFCAEDAACAEAYPDLKKQFWALVEKLGAQPMKTASGELDDEKFFETIDNRNSLRDGIRGLTPYVPKLVAELGEGETTTWDRLMAGTLPPKPSIDALLESAKDLSRDEKVLAWLAWKNAEQAKAMEDAVTLTLQQLESDRAASEAGAEVAVVFDAEMAAALNALEAREDKVSFAQDYLALRPVAPEAGPLIALVAEHFDGATRDRLVSLVSLMSPDDLADTFRRIGADNKTLEEVLEKEFEMMIYACQEDMDINSVDGVRALHATLDMAEGFEEKVEKHLSGLYETCALFPPQPRDGFHDPVTSDIPALVLSGLLDTQTAASWGPDTASHLPNGRSVVFPETGHGALAFSDCARDLGVAFIEDPTAELDTSCTEALKPRFVLPDGTMSGG